MADQIAQAESAKASAQEAVDLLRGELAELQRSNAEVIEKVRQEAAAKEDAIRADARSAAEAAVEAQLTELAVEREQSETELRTRIEAAEAARAATEQAGVSLLTQMDELRRENAATLEKAQEEAVEREAEVRAARQSR